MKIKSLFIDDCKNQNSSGHCEHWKQSGFCKGKYGVWMNLNCKKSCGGCRENDNDVKYIKELVKKENHTRFRSHRMASIQSKNKLQLQVTYFITNFKQVNNKIAVEIIFGIVDFNFIPISTNAMNLDEMSVRMPGTQPGSVGKFSVVLMVLIVLLCKQLNQSNY